MVCSVFESYHSIRLLVTIYRDSCTFSISTEYLKRLVTDKTFGNDFYIVGSVNVIIIGLTQTHPIIVYVDLKLCVVHCRFHPTSIFPTLMKMSRTLMNV